MTRTQVQQIIVIVLLIVFSAVWATTRQATAPAPSSAATSPAPDAAGSPGVREAETPPGEGASAEAASLVRDPFGLPGRLLEKIRERERALELERQREDQHLPPPPLAVETKPPLELSTLELQGIFWGTDRPQAIINRKILSVGDTIEGAEIVSITEGGVTLIYGEQRVELKPITEVRAVEGEESGWSLRPHEHE